MKKEDIEFLKNLQHEMLTQDKVGQADPRFWVVMQKAKEYNVEDDCDGIYIHDTEAAENVFEGNIDKELVNWIISDLENVQSCEYDGIDITVTYEDMEYIISSDYDLQSFLNKYKKGRYNVGTYRIKEEIAENTMFLTLKECQQHIKFNGYHYHSPYPYAMTAWRSPQVEQLYKILQNTNWDELKETKHEKTCDEFLNKFMKEGTDNAK